MLRNVRWIMTGQIGDERRSEVAEESIKAQD